VKIKETKKTDKWLLFRNKLYHEGEKLKSGRKIILKANIIAINKIKITLPDNDAFGMLFYVRQHTIDQFNKKKNNVLLASSLQEYVFYRKYFEKNIDVVPFQALFAERSRLKFLNIFDGYPVVKFDKFGSYNPDDYCCDYLAGNSEDDLQDAQDDIKDSHGYEYNVLNGSDSDRDSDSDDSNDSSDENGLNLDEKSLCVLSYASIPAQVENVSKYLRERRNKNGEIESIIELMLFYFWGNALQFENSGNIRLQDIRGLIKKKVSDNLKKIKKMDRKVFDINDMINPMNPSSVAPYVEKIFSDQEWIDDHIKYNTIEYKHGGSYHCNESVYEEYVANLCFGFLKI